MTVFAQLALPLDEEGDEAPLVSLEDVARVVGAADAGVLTGRRALSPPATDRESREVRSAETLRRLVLNLASGHRET